MFKVISQRFVARTMYAKQLNQLVSLRYKEIITIRTVALCKKLYFFHEKPKKQEKEAGTDFILLSQSRNMIG